jgi:hypothetical protein
MESIQATRVYPSGAWRLNGLHDERLFFGYSLREAKRVYRDEYRQKRLGDRNAAFYTLAGELTPYAFACGYVETYGDFRLYLDGCYHVQNAEIWETFSKLTDARRAAKKLSKGN